MNIPAAWRLPILIGSGLLLALLIWFYGAQTKNSIERWWFQRGVAREQKELQESKALAEDLLKQLSVERAKREVAETVLADKRLNSEEKLRIYESVIKETITPTPVLDTDALCERARALDIPCE